MVVHLRKRAHVGTVDLAFLDVAAGSHDRGLHDSLAPHLHAAHEHATLHLGAGMHLHAHLQIRIFKNHGIVDMRRFLERTEDDGIAHLRSSLDAGMRANPTVAHDVRVRNHGALTHDGERKRGLLAEQLQLLVESGFDLGFAPVEELHVHEVHRDVGEHAHLARTHLVAHRDGRTYHVVYLAAAHQRAHVVHHGTAADQHVGKHRHLAHERVLDDAVVDEAVVDSRRERHVARQEEGPVEGGQADIAHKHGIVDTLGSEVRLHEDAAPVLATVAILFQCGNLVGIQGAELTARSLGHLEALGQGHQYAVLQHFFKFEQSLHTQKID